MAIVKKYLSKDKTIRMASIMSTDLVQESIRHQSISALSLVLSGRLLTGTVLMASQLKEDQTVGVYLKGDGPVGTLFAEATYDGRVRSYCSHRNASQENLPTLGAGLGKGFMEVVRDLPFQKEPHRGTVAIQTGEVADDIAYYLRQSQQIPAIVSLSVLPDENGCAYAGGYIVELMPGYDESTLDKIERIQAQVPAIGHLLEGGATAQDLISDFLLNIPFDELTHPHEVVYKCKCSVERMERSLMTLGATEIRQLISANEVMEVTCEFCGKVYEINPLQLQRLLKQIT